MIGTTIYNQKPRAEIWQKSHERKTITDTWDPQDSQQEDWRTKMTR